MAGLRLGAAPLPRVGLLRPALRVRGVVHRAGAGLRRQPDRRGDARDARHAHRGRHREPLARPQRRREPGPVPAHARGRVRGRCARAAPEDRHGEPEHQPAGPRDLPHPSRFAPPHRRPLVHLPALRLHALHLGRARAHHPLDLHAGVPGPPAALRLGDREAGRRRPAAAPAAQPARVRAAEPHLRRALQAQADPARQRRLRRRLGRPAHADARGCAAARLHARRLPPDGRAHRRVEVRHVDRHERARGRDARRPQRRGRAAHRRARPGAARRRQLPRGRGGDLLRAESPAAPRARPARAPLHARAVDRPRRLHGGAAEGLLPARPRDRGAPALRVHRQVHRRGTRRRRARRDDPLHLRPDHPQRHAGRGGAQGQGQHPLAVRRRGGRGRSAAVRPAVPCSLPRCAKSVGRARWRSRGSSGRPCGGGGGRRRGGRRGCRARLPRRPECRLEARDHGAGRACAGRARRQRRATSSSAPAISSPTVSTTHPAERCSTGR